MLSFIAVGTIIGGLGVPQQAEANIFSGLIRFFYPEDKTATGDTGAAAAISMPLLGSNVSVSPPPSSSGIGGFIPEPDPLVTSSLDSALIASRNPLGTVPSATEDQILLYMVNPGDTPGLIADRFGISLNTLLWANNITNPNLIKVGDELVILPVTGVQYEVKKGDTIESIAKKFKGDSSEIRGFNGLGIDEKLAVGDTLIIPDGEVIVALPSFASGGVPRAVRNLPNYIGYYMRPITGGRKTQGIHGFNGVDLASSCGMPVYASAEGTVIITRTSGWNGGYGRYIVISHANGTQTLYSHLSALIAVAGQRVGQGMQIGALGTSGNSTGCHVHFEIRGAKNPF